MGCHDGRPGASRDPEDAEGGWGAAASPSSPSTGARARSLELEARELLRADPLPERARVLAVSQELARPAETTEPYVRIKLAADLRARLFRVEHLEADGREARALYQRAAPLARSVEGCDAALEAVLLFGELEQDPKRFYRELSTQKKLFEESPCAASFERHLRALSTYRSPEDELRDADPPPLVIAPPLLSLSSGASAVRAKVTKVEPYGSADRARVVISLDRPAPYEVVELPGFRLAVDFAGADLVREGPIAVGGILRSTSSAVTNVSAGPTANSSSSSRTRISLDLAGPAYRRVFYLPDPFRVIVDIANHPPQSASSQGRARVVERVALDAGHGGTDPGAIGPSGLREKDVTLDIAHLAAPVLSRELGILTVLTRDDDRLVPLDERAARANGFHADLFVSIHCNASENPRARGIMSFVLDASRDDGVAKIVARENATSLLADVQIASVASGLGANLGPRSRHLAELLQRATMSSLAMGSREPTDQGVKTAGFFVLVGAEMPSVLFETSFISNPLEERRLSTTEYRQKLADAIVNAVRAYREGR